MNDDTQLEIKRELFDNLRKQEWYIHFIGDLEALVIEGEYNARWELLKTYHEVGKEIVEKTSSFNQAQVYDHNIYDVVAEDIKKSKSTVYKSVEFYKKFPNAMTDISSLPEGKNLTWSKLVSKYLHEPRKEIVTLPENNNVDGKPTDVRSNKAVTAIKMLDTLIFSLKNSLDLYLELTSTINDVNNIARIYIIYILKYVTFKDLQQSVSNYISGKSEHEADRLNILLHELNKIKSGQTETPPTTSSLFENSLPGITYKTNVEKKQLPENAPTPVKEFISLYSELYLKKYNRKPLIGPKIYASIGKLLKIKTIDQRFSFDEIKILLQLYSKPENSNFCDFAPHPFFSDNVFNKLLAQKSKNNNSELGGKYDKYEL